MNTGDREDQTTPAVADDLLPELDVIEQQPLAQRAAGYAALVDALARRLDTTPEA